MMTNEEMGKLHIEPDGTDAPKLPEADPLAAEALEESLPFGAELLAVLDAMLGVSADG
jgi:hypothetical protein